MARRLVDVSVPNRADCRAAHDSGRILRAYVASAGGPGLGAVDRHANAHGHPNPQPDADEFVDADAVPYTHAFAHGHAHTLPLTLRRHLSPTGERLAIVFKLTTKPPPRKKRGAGDTKGHQENLEILGVACPLQGVESWGLIWRVFRQALRKSG